MGKAAKRTPTWAILLVCLCTLLISAGQVLMKMAVGDPFPQILYSPLLLASVALYLGAGMMMVYALKHGDLSVLYPIVSLGFVWVLLASMFLLDERLTAYQIGGTAAIIAGISIIGHHGRRGG